MKTLNAAVLTIALVRPLAAQASGVEHQLIAARDTIWRAWFTHDTALLRRFLPPAAASLEGPNGARWNDRKQIVDGSAGFAQSKSRLVDLKFINTHIAHTGHSALVSSQYMSVVEAEGKRDTIRGRATELFVQVGKTWVNPYWQLEPENAVTNNGREVPLPDTLGANFSLADTAKMTGTLADYDGLLGTWEFKFQNRGQNGTYAPPFTGHWTFEKRPGGGLIEDHWRPDDPSLPMGSSLYTYRTFDPQRKVWQMIGSSSNGGEVQPGLTWFDGKYLYAIQRANGGKALSRIRYESIEANHFLWRSDRSYDGGKTWIRDFGIMEATRIGKADSSSLRSSE